MKLMILLLISAVALLVSPAANPHHRPQYNLNHVFDLAGKYNKSLHEQYFVEDVSHLAEGSHRCGDKFFCKVHNILHEHEHFGKRKVEMDLVRNLQMYINGTNINCTELLREVTAPGVSKPIPELVKSLTHCIQHRNLHEA